MSYSTNGGILIQLKISDLGNSWKFKLKHLRRYFRWWNYNLKGKRKNDKKRLLRQH
jgi:hypothetical protein